MSALERAAIEAAIPHRPPFLFVDRVLALEADSIESEWTPPISADWFRGHYPGEPVLPGALLCEHAAQTAAILVSHLEGGFRAADGFPALTRLYEARFRRAVRPGELLSTRARLEERVGPAWFFTARVQVGAARALDLRFALAASRALARATGGEG